MTMGFEGDSNVQLVESLEYSAPNGHSLELDLYVPVNDDDSLIPTAIYLHGGGFLAGHRADMSDRLSGLAAQGIAVASVSYRLASVAAYPAQLHDVHAAIQWLQLNGAEYGLKTEKLGLWGSSAGGTLVLLSAYSPHIGVEAKESIAAVVDFFGPSDLTERAAEKAQPPPGCTIPDVIFETVAREGLVLPFDPPMEAQLLGVRSMEEAREQLDEISPLSFAGRPGPPVLLMHGTADGMVPVEQSIWFHDAVRDAGGDARLMMVEGVNHEDPAFARPEVLGAVAGFLREQLV